MHRASEKITKREISEAELETLKYNASMILAQARASFQRIQPFVGNVSMSLNLVPTRDVNNPTAATDGSNIFFDIAFLSTLSLDQQMFVIGHEVYHNVLMHFIRQEGRDRNLWNIATDMEINGILEDDGLVLIPDCIKASKYGFRKGLAAEEYYELLVKDNERNQKSSNGNNGSKSNGSGGSGAGQFDKHIYDTDEQADAAEGENAEEQFDKYGKIGTDPDFNPHMTERAIEKVREAAISAAQQVERSRGSLPEHLQRIVNKLLETKVNWKDYLAKYVTSCSSNDTTWNRPNRRFAHSGMFLPGHDGKQINIAVVLDTSGSTVVDAERFLSELNAMVNAYPNYKVTIVHCDASVQHVDEFSNDTPFDFNGSHFKMHGGGGTRLKPAFDHIELNDVEADVIVCFTDGYCEKFTVDMAPNCPVLWLLTCKKMEKNFEFGDVIEFDND